jgi:tetratricopeptide (TPR) repeat protein
MNGEHQEKLIADGKQHDRYGRYVEAVEAFRSALVGLPESSHTRLEALVGLGKALRETVSLDASIETLKEAVPLAEKLHGADSVEYAETLGELGLSHLELRNFDLAETDLLKAVEILKAQKPQDELRVAQAVTNLGTLYIRTERIAEAEPLLTRALGVRRQLLKTYDRQLADSLSSLAQLHLAKGKPALAPLLLQEALSIDLKVLGENHPQTSRTMGNLAAALRLTGKLTESEKLLKKVNGALADAGRNATAEQIVCLNEHGAVELQLRKMKEAQGHFEQALVLADKCNRIDDQIILASLVGLGSAYLNQGNFKEAEPCLRRALTLLGSVKKGTVQLENSLLNSLLSSLVMQGKFGHVLSLVPDSVRARQTQNFDQMTEILKQLHDAVKSKDKN